MLRFYQKVYIPRPLTPLLAENLVTQNYCYVPERLRSDPFNFPNNATMSHCLLIKDLPAPRT